MDMIVINTFHQVLDCRRYTWKAPGDIKRYEIDFILVKRKYRNQIKSSHIYTGCDVDSDHNLVLTKYNIKFNRGRKRLRRYGALTN